MIQVALGDEILGLVGRQQRRIARGHQNRRIPVRGLLEFFLGHGFPAGNRLQESVPDVFVQIAFLRHHPDPLGIVQIHPACLEGLAETVFLAHHINVPNRLHLLQGLEDVLKDAFAFDLQIRLVLPVNPVAGLSLPRDQDGIIFFGMTHQVHDCLDISPRDRRPL